MPQFDKITFFNQIFWLFIFFSGFYLISLKIFLPKLSSVLKARTKKLQKGSEGVVFFSKEQDKVTELFNSSIENMSSVVKSSIFDSTEKMNVWVEQKVTGLNKNNLNLSNTVMEKALHKQIATTFLFSQN
jgi:hypothetical protein